MNHEKLIAYKEILDRKYGRIGKYYQPKAQKFAVKLSEWKLTGEKQDFINSYTEQYIQLLS